MHLKTRTWFLVSLLCFILAGFFWHLGNERYRRDFPADGTNREPAVTPIKELGANNFHHAPPPILAAPGQSSTINHQLSTPSTNPLLTNRLSNTSKGIKELMRSDNAVLLRNALIDTSGTDAVKIPEHLRADGDAGSYVIQANGPLDNAFRAKLTAAGASIVSYIPNNAYLVRVSEAGANQMRSLPQTQSVLPWEPYYKLDLPLLALAVQNQPLAPEAKLSVLVFPGEREAGLEALKALGAKILGEDRSPFGHEWVVQPPSDVLPALARLPIVESIQVHHPRQVVNDLTRPRVGVALDSTNATNYLNLTGQGVSVSVNDTGVDAGHPDFDTRVSGDTMASTIDYDGHGTHVAGTIAGSGMNSSTVTKVPPGSTNGFNFRGMAPKARIFASLIDLITGPVISDTYLQETAAINTNLISNNSWGYADDFDYDLSAASFDAAVRDAVPGQPGPNPVVFVFAAGNSGNGSADGLGGDSESIGSPATAKNVISVGALEKARGITNLVIGSDGKTNQGFFAQTDSDHQITSFSSRGNVGIGLEGPAGRFKPDLVAPGSFVISTRASNWKDPQASGGVIVNRFRGEIIKAGATNPYTIFIPGNASRFDIITRSNALSPNPFPALPIYAKAGAPTTTNDFLGTGNVTIQPIAPGQWYYTVGNGSGQSVNYDLITVIYLQNTNSGNYFEVLSNLNSELAPWYRYESGTSQAAPAVSGILALMQEFFQTKLMLTNDQNIPALMKALLINGARSVGQQYSLQVQNSINYQGWGVVNLSNSIPPAMNGGLSSQATWPIAFFHTNTLYTGQSHTRKVTLNNFARAYPLRFTLVWTDPPGNPAASLKLVNDLDLIVSNNIATNEVYYGNNIPQGSDFNDVSDPTDTNSPPTFDVVNNVENVFINRPLAGTNYSVIVRAHRVNVNAVDTQTNGVLQDYALVISCGNTLFTNAISVSDISVVPQSLDDTNRFVKSLTNGVPLFHERVGANNPLIDVLNNGVTNQWNFYTFTITPDFTNANLAFITFLSANLAAPRYLDADIDLYVSRDPKLLDLDTSVINDAINSVNGGRVGRSRGGTETILYTNVAQGDVFYIGVKSEDQQAGEFGILGIGFDDFGRDGNGNIRLVFTPASGVDIPDGSPELPQGTNMFAFVFDPADVRRVVLTNTVTHENGGDLYGVFSHLSTGIPKQVVLNNHRSFSGTQTFLYDDAPRNALPGSQIPDGPGRLRDFQGEPAAGLWLFTMIDNSPFHTGRVESLIGYIEPADKTNINGTLLTANPMSWSECLPFDVPLNATNVNIYLVQQPPNPLSVDLYVLIGDCPDFVNYDKKLTIDPPGGVMSLSVVDSPGLQPGNRYYYAYYNPNSVTVDARLRVEFQYGLRPIASQTYFSPDTPKILPDDAVTNSFITVTNNRTIADVKVGLRLDHSRLSDTVVRLVSPQGTRILLTESRGGWAATNYGFGFPVTNVFPFAANGKAQEFRTNIDTGVKSGVVTIDYDFFQVYPDDLRIYYEGQRIYDSGYILGTGTVSINYGPGLSTVVTIVMDEGGNPFPDTEWNIVATVTGPWNYTTFTDNPNLGGPIKFGLPPYSIIPTNRTVLSNSFEGVDMKGTNQMNFTQGDTFAGWTVMTNGVAVFSDTNHLYADPLLASTNWGTNFLALSAGQVCLPLTTNIIVPDRDYVLNFIHRKVSSSPTQSVDIKFFYTADIFQQLNVTNQPSGGGDPQLATKVRLCPGQNIVITAAPGQGAEGLTNELFAGLPLYGLIGCFSFSQEILTSNTVAGAPFYIGTNSAVITVPTDPGDYYLFLGINNNDFTVFPTNNPSGLFAVTAAWQHCQDAMSEVRLGANAIPIVGSPQWKAETIRFLANPTMTNLCLAPKLNTTMLFDSFQIDELVSTSYYQSDEPMTPFKGQLALGDWRLEVLDNRSGTILSGGTNDSGTLFSWSLNLIFADGPTAIPLTNGVIHTNVVRGSQIKYFIVAVPNEVVRATNIVSSLGLGSGVELLYSPFGLPTGNSPPDPLSPVLEGNTPIVVSQVAPAGAELPIGRFYYLGVRNVDPTEVNNFIIQAEFNIPVYPLPNGLPGLINQRVAANSNSFADIRLHSELAVTNMHYYYVDINSTNIVSMTISVFPFQNSLASVNGDVNIVLRRALPVVDLFPRPTFFEYESTQPNFGNELILVNSNSLPVKLTPGRWYVGVYNTTNATANYDIVAQWSVAPLWNYVDLTNGVPQPFLVNSFDPLTNFYRFVMDQTNANAAVLFEIYTNLDYSGDPDLLVKRADVPSPDLYEFSYLQAHDSNFPFSWLPEKIALRTNVFLPGLSGTNMFIPGVDATNWFLQIVNPDPLGGTISGWVCAKLVDPITGLLYDCQDMSVVVSNNFNPGTPFSFAFNTVPGEYYAVEETLTFKNWSTAKTIQATKPKTVYTAPAPASQSGATHFYRIRHVRPPSR